MHWSPFISGFFAPELKTFLRKKWVLLLSLLLMILSLWTIGFNNGSKELLKDRMESPFIKFVSFDTSDRLHNISAAIKDLENQETKNRFLISHVEKVHYSYEYFINSKNERERKAYRMLVNGAVGKRSLNPVRGNSLYKYIFDNENSTLFRKGAFELDSTAWSIVVSREFIRSMGFDIMDPPLSVLLASPTRNTGSGIPLEIAAIVDKLPDKCDIVVGSRLYKALANGELFFDPINQNHFNNEIRVFIETREPKKAIKECLELCGIGRISIRNDVDHFLDGWTLTNTVSNRSKGEAEEFIKSLVKCLDKVNVRKVKRQYAFENAPSGNNGAISDLETSRLMVGMSSLDSIKEFSDYMNEKWRIKIDLSKIESTKNFNIFNKISSILSVTLSILTIILVIYILSRSIIEHINKNSANLGTLKAFGLANSSIVAVYSGIAAVIVFSIYICSFAVAAGLGALVNQLIMGEQIVAGINSAELFSLPFSGIYFLEFVVVPVLIIATLVFSKLHGKTPGDLVYGR